MADVRLGSMIGEVTGEGRAVVLVHGLGGSSNSFQPLMPSLADVKAIRPDLPGAGRSGTRPGRPGLDGLTAALVDYLDALGVKRAHFVGHSMGTLLCQALAASQPERVSGMTLFGPILEPPAAARDALKGRAEAARQNGMAGIADAVSAASLSAATKASNPAVTAFVRESLMRQDSAGYARHCEALAAMTPSAHGAIGCRVRLVTGADDPIAPPDMARKLAELIPGAKVDILSACGHWSMLEAPRETAALLRADLDANED